MLPTNSADVDVPIPLNRYSFFEELEGRMLPPMQLAIELELTPDAEVLYSAASTARLVIDRFHLWVPRLEPRDSMKTKFISEFQKPTKWSYLRERYSTSAPTRKGGDFRNSASIDRLRQVLFIFREIRLIV